VPGIYIHVPFCLTKCIYCDFFSLTDIRLMDAYLHALLKEMALRRDFLDRPPTTFYLGGGTPSLLPLQHLERIVEAADRHFGLAHCTELTLEANPDDLSPLYLRSLRSLPFNRISIGVQSFDDDALRFLRRRHTARQASRAIDQCRRYGFDNLSIDLIYGLPHGLPERWNRTLDHALRLNPPHISAYHLTYEEGTPLCQQLRQGLLPIDEDTSAEHFFLLRRRLIEAGYDHYELSNFAQPRRLARHNTAYWTGEPYIGLGPSAHSFDGTDRGANSPSLTAYLDALDRGTTPFSSEPLSPEERFNDLLITRLRTKWGIRTDEVRRRFGAERALNLRRDADPFIKRGLLDLVEQKTERDDQEQTLRLTPRGMLLCDAILRELIVL
jgi:oxygen-independent coproporphyrinogen-3 oxidase